jgi:hypothetical protein
MELPYICSAFGDPDLSRRLQSLETLTSIPIPEDYLQDSIIPRLMNYLDDSEEVLLLTITQIEKVSKTVKSEKTVISLLKPLQSLANIIDEPIRQSSVQSLIRILQYFSLTHKYSYHFFKELISASDSGIFSALDLVLNVFLDLNEVQKSKVLKSIFQVYTKKNFNIKAKIAECLTILHPVSGNFEIFKCFLKSFLKDPEDLIRISGVSLAISMKFDLFSDGFEFKDSSWKVRYFIAQNLGVFVEFIASSEVSSIVKEYLNDFEPEVINVTYGNLSVLFRHNYDEIFINEILTQIQNMSQDLPGKSLQVISSVLQLFPVVGPSWSHQFLLSVLQSLLSSADPNIEILVMQQIDQIFPVIPQDFLISSAFPVFFKLLENKQWKIRVKSLELLPKIAKNIDEELFDEYFKKFLIGSLNDLIHAVRLQAIKTASSVFQVYGNSWFINNLKKEIQDKSASECFVNRISALHLLDQAFELIDFEIFGEFFFGIFARLSHDRVPNVRIFVARLVGKVLLSRVLELHKEEVLEISARLKNDVDQDVRMAI